MNFTVVTKFKSGLSPGVIALYSNRLIQNAAASLLGLFLPIFLLQKYNSLQLVLFFYLGLWLFNTLTVPLGAQLASRLTFRRAMIFSVFGGTVAYLSFYWFDHDILLFSLIALVALLWDKMLYWVPYHSDFAKFTDKKNRGKTLGLLSSFASLLGVVTPVLAGFVIIHYGFDVLFLLVVVLYFCSIFPLFLVPETIEQYTFGYWQTWRLLFHPRDFKMFLTYFSQGFEDMIGVVIWPIFLWQVLKGDFQAVGLIASLILLVSIILQLLMGDFADRLDKKKLIRYGTGFYALGWIFKIFVQTGFQIFIASTYHNIAKIAMRSPFDTLVYEKMADAGHYVDEYSALRNMAISLGRVALILILLPLVALPLNYLFFFAAIAALFMNLI